LVAHRVAFNIQLFNKYYNNSTSGFENEHFKFRLCRIISALKRLPIINNYK
jgi:hypothetical protein